jgi:predicted DNA-binding transcriptional regulator AlpA
LVTKIRRRKLRDKGAFSGLLRATCSDLLQLFMIHAESPVRGDVRAEIMMEELLTLKELCTRLKVGRASIYRWQREFDFPRPLKFGRASRWSSIAVVRWVDARAR